MGVNIGLDGAFLMVGIIFTITGVGLSAKFKHDKMRCSLEVHLRLSNGLVESIGIVMATPQNTIMRHTDMLRMAWNI